MLQIIQILSAAHPLPMEALFLGCGTWIVTRLIRRSPDILKSYAEILRARNGL